ncbi:Chaperone protein DnaJ [compost metagenome]
MHEQFILKGCNLNKTIIISPALAALGGKYKLELLNETIYIDLPKHLKNGQNVIIEEKGYIFEDKKRGDLILNIHIDMPDNISEREEKIYEQLLKLENRKK